MKLSISSKDVTAGLLVSLIALPLSMGIALACGFPPSSGIIAAIIGGMITGWFGGAKLTIKGPAAGLIVIVAGAVVDLADPGDPASGVARAAAVVVVAGAIQVALGLLKCGVLTEFIPLSVIHGMLAGIGIIIISKQSHGVFGVTPHGKSPGSLLLEVPSSAAHLNPEIFLIGALGVLIMALYPKIKSKALQKIPAVLVVMAIAITLGALFGLGENHSYEVFQTVYNVGPNFLVHLPASVRDSIFLPDWSQILTLKSVLHIVFFVVVGSAESLLTVTAVNGMVSTERRSDCNKDLVALGVGNVCSGLLGGLPMISEIVRSKANVDAGAETGWSNFFHGTLLLTYLALLGSLLGMVPGAALAGILVFVGFRLASPKTFVHAYHTGPEQFFCFALTCFLTVTEDLLVGIVAGMVAAYAFQIWKGARFPHLFKAPVAIAVRHENAKVVVIGSALGSNFLSFRTSVAPTLKTSPVVTVDFSKCTFVDFAFLEKLDALEAETGISIRRQGLEKHKPLCKHRNATRISPRVPGRPQVVTQQL